LAFDRSLAAIGWRLSALPGWRSWPPRRLKDLRPRGWQREGQVALTFDDGPDPTFTPQVLAILADLDVRATFFMCGAAAALHPQLVQAVADAGHTIGGHTWRHVDIRGLSEDAWQREVRRTHEVLSGLSGRPVRYFRPPWGDYDATALRRLRADGTVPVLWSAWGRDWEGTDPDRIVAEATRGLRRGAIVLLHDACGDDLADESRRMPGTVRDRSATVRALPALVRVIRSAGLRCVALAP
jgi:peptidoglycan-N-acetylglucosamine deacetylase